MAQTDIILEDPNPSGVSFGNRMAFAGGTLAVLDGLSGVIYTFDAGTGALLPTTITDPQSCCTPAFGTQIVARGNHLLVSNPLDPNGFGGFGVVYEFDPTDGSLVTTYADPASTSGFGHAVAARDDRIAIGVRSHQSNIPPDYPPVPGQVEIFDATTATLVTTIVNPAPFAGILGDSFGGSPDGGIAFVGPHLVVTDITERGTGRVYLFDAKTGRLAHTMEPPAPFNGPGTTFGLVVPVPGELVVQTFPDSTQPRAIYRYDADTLAIRKVFSLPTDSDRVLGAFGTAELHVRFGLGVAIVDPSSGAQLSFLDVSNAFPSLAVSGGSIAVAATGVASNGSHGVVHLFPAVATCGNGATEPGEQCDDSNLVDGDGCDSSCTPTACGNAIVTTGELCDDGNTAEGDGCSADCSASCGDGATQSPEQCDDGNAIDGDGCDSNCTATACGNGIRTAGESCDDGNVADGDGCSSTCQVESLDLEGSWQIRFFNASIPTGQLASTSFIQLDAGGSPGTLTAGEGGTCGTRAPGNGPLGLVESCAFVPATTTATQDENRLTLPDDGMYTEDVTFVDPVPLPAYSASAKRVIQRVDLIGVSEGVGGLAERVSGLAGVATVTAYDESGAVIFDNSGNPANPFYNVPFVMRRTDAHVGNAVSVRPEDGTTITFTEVVLPGEAGVIVRTDATASLPGGFVVTSSSVANGSAYADVITTGSPDGAILTCLSYPDVDDDGFVDFVTPPLPEAQLSILHAENGTFVDRTLSRDPVENRICAQTSSLSEFVIGHGPAGVTTTTTSTTTTSLAPGTTSTSGAPSTSTTTTTTTLPTPACPPVAAAGCQVALSRKSSVKLKKGSTDATDKLGWKWVSSGSVATGDYGTPTSTTDYSLCIYDQTGLVSTARIPAGGQCGTKPCWTATATGAKYANKTLLPDGVQKVVLKSGALGRAKIVLKGKGASLPFPALPLTPSVKVQLVRGDGGACWEASYGSALVNTSTAFKAKSD